MTTAAPDLAEAPASDRTAPWPAGTADQERSPYPGLRPFDRDEADVFFGREQQTDQLLAKLASHRLLAVVGSSGSGKSSLVRAGLIASLETGLMASAGSVWRVAVMRPGSAPMPELAKALLAKWALGGDDADSEMSRGLMEAVLRRGPLSLVEVVKEARLPPKTNLLLVVDQFEEIFRFRREGSRDDADAFVELLLTTAQTKDSNVFTVLTMRSDFLGGCAVFAGLPEALNEAQFLCPQLTRQQRELAITGPARVFGGDVEEELVNHLLNEVGPEPDNLPVLQHLLMRMWAHARQRERPSVPEQPPTSQRWPVLTVEDERAVGGLKEALSQHADEALAQLAEEHRRLAESAFRRLCDRRIGHSDTRRPSQLGELAAVAGYDKNAADYDRDLRVVVDLFRGESFGFLRPSASEAIDPETFIDISHEALIRFWKQLGHWTRCEFHSAETYRLLAQTAELWQSGDSALWTSPNLENALAWKEREQPNEAWAARYGGNLGLALRFLDESERKQREIQALDRQKAVDEWTQELARGRKKNSLLLGLVALLVLGIAGVYVCLFHEYDADYNDFVRSWGAPVGLQALSSDEQAHNSVSFRLRKKGLFGDIVSMKAIDATGALTTKHSAMTYADYSTPDSPKKECEWRYDYDAHHRVLHESAYDKAGNPVWTFVYSPFSQNGAEECTKEPCIRTGFFLRPTRGVADAQGTGTATATNSSAPVQGPANVAPPSLPAQDALRTGPSQASPVNGAEQSAALAANRVSSPSAGSSGSASPVLTSGSWGEGRNVAEFQIEYEPGTGHERVVRYFDQGGKRVRGRDQAFGIRRTYDPKGWETRTESLDDHDHVMVDKTGNAVSVAEFADNGDVIAVQRLDASGRLTSAKVGYARVEYKYDEFHRVTEERYFDESGPGAALKPTLLKAGYHAIRYVRDDAGRIIEQSYWDTDLKPTSIAPDDDNGYAGWYHMYQTSYDSKGNPTEYRHFDSARKPVITSDGYSILRLTLDAQGRVKSEEHLNTDGKTLMASKWGVAKRETEYDGAGNAAFVRSLDPSGNPTLNSDGYYEERREFDGEGHQIKVRYSGVDHQPKAVSDGYAGYQSEYTDGTLTAWSYFDVARHPVATRDGYFGIRLKLDQGREIERTFVDANGRPTTVAGGYAGYKTEYDEFGNPSARTNVDVKGDPVIIDDGTAGWRVESDALGREKKKTYLGIDGKPAVYQDGYASIVEEYDMRDNISTQTFLNAAGQPVPSRSGYAEVRREYDPLGNVTREAYFDATGKSVASSDGYAHVKHEYDERGQLKKSRYFDAAGKPLALKFGYFALENRYNTQGLLAETTFLTADGHPTPSTDGYARTRYEYDDQYRRVQTIGYFDDQGKPVRALVEGYHSKRSKYDSLGRVIRVEYSDGAGVPTLSAEGFFAADMLYDSHGSVSSRSYYDTNKAAVEHRLGYSRVESSFDDTGNEQEERRFDVNSKRTRTTKYIYDPTGNLIEVAYFTLDGHPVSVDGVSKQSREYDAMRNLITTSSFNASGQLFLKSVTAYDDQKRATRSDYFDGYGAKALGPDHAARFEIGYDTHSNESEYRFFDAQGAPGRPSDHVAVIRLKYDADNDLFERSTFSAKGDLLSLYGVAKDTMQYDAGRKVLEERYGADGKLAPCTNGSSSLVARTRFSYDAFGRVTDERYEMPNGDSAPLDCYPGAQHRTSYEYDDRGNRAIEKHFGGANDEPVDGFVLAPAVQTLVSQIGYVRASEWRGSFDAKGNLTSFTCFNANHQKTREWSRHP